jgi:hypothetical protein
MHKALINIFKFFDYQTRVSFFFLCAISKLRKATSSFVISVCPLVQTEKLPSQWADFHEILYLNILRKSVKNIQVLLNSDIKTYVQLWQYFAEFFLE